MVKSSHQSLPIARPSALIMLLMLKQLLVMMVMSGMEEGGVLVVFDAERNE